MNEKITIAADMYAHLNFAAPPIIESLNLFPAGSKMSANYQY